MSRLPLLALLLIACGDKTGDDTASDGGTADGGAADGGSGGDVGDGGGDGGGVSSDCSEYFPVDQAGALWTYRYSGAIEGTLTHENMGSELYQGAKAWRVQSLGDISVSGTTQSFEVHAWYVCEADGVKMLASETTVEGTSSAGSFESWTNVSYTSPPLVSPKTLAEGDSWTVSYEGITSSATGDTPFSYEQTNTVIGSERITVEAGTFDTLVVEYAGLGSPTEQHLAKGIGAVSADGIELVSFTP